MPASKKTVKASRLVLKGERFTMTTPESTHKGTYSVGPTVMPIGPCGCSTPQSSIYVGGFQREYTLFVSVSVVPDRASFRRDSPHDVRQVLRSETIGWLEFIEFDFDFDVTLLAFDFRFAIGSGHQVGACEVHFCSSTAMLIVDRPSGAADYFTRKTGVTAMGSTAMV